MIHYLIGDATAPIKTPAIITHCCNDKGLWGRGFVLALRKKFPETETMYRSLFKNGKKPDLGQTQLVLNVGKNIHVANLIGQKGIHRHGNRPPIRYEALATGLEGVSRAASLMEATIHMPRIGCGLAGAKWGVVEEIIQDAINVDVFIYTLENEKNKWNSKL